MFFIHRTTANEKRKKRHDDELRRIKEKHELDLSEQRKRLNLQMDKQSDDFDAILQRKLKEKDDYFKYVFNTTLYINLYSLLFHTMPRY